MMRRKICIPTLLTLVKLKPKATTWVRPRPNAATGQMDAWQAVAAVPAWLVGQVVILVRQNVGE